MRKECAVGTVPPAAPPGLPQGERRVGEELRRGHPALRGNQGQPQQVPVDASAALALLRQLHVAPQRAKQLSPSLVRLQRGNELNRLVLARGGREGQSQMRGSDQKDSSPGD